MVYTSDWEVAHPRPRHTSYSVYDASRESWSVWQKLQMSAGGKFRDAGAGCVQRYDLEDGSILLPIYFCPAGKNSRVAVTRCRFDGQRLTYLQHGNELAIDDDTRGLHEPSLTRFNDRYFLTIRNDKRGFVTTSPDGLQFHPIRPWTFDDGSDLGNYSAQQHWVTHSDGLFLVCTRRGAGNDHVFGTARPCSWLASTPNASR